METEEEQVGSGLERVGKILRSAREEKNYTLVHVANVTRIKAQILEEIENGQLSNNPGPAFVRGFIRSYCELLGLESQPLLAELAEISDLASPSKEGVYTGRPIEEPKGGKKKYFLLVLIVALLGAGGYVYMNFDDLKKLTSSDTPPTTVIVEETTQPVETIVETKPTTTLPAQVLPEPTPPPEMEENAPPDPAPEEPLPSIEETPPTLPEETSGESIPTEGLALFIKAKEASWLYVSADGGKPTELSLKAGDEYNLGANEQFMLTVGNSKNIEVFLNGKLQPIDTDKELVIDWLITPPLP